MDEGRQDERGERRQFARRAEGRQEQGTRLRVHGVRDHQAGASARVAAGAFPATRADLESKAFLDTAFPYFGGQQANRIFAESARNVGADWSYLPYQVYANSVFNDTVGKAYVSPTTLTEGLKKWQEAYVTYGNDQGFTVNK